MTRGLNITLQGSDNRSRFHNGIAVVMAVVIAAAMLLLPACQRKPVMAHSRFVHLPSAGWQQSLPLAFTPEFDDSTALYDITLAVRHSNNYPYRNLSLTVDCIAADSTIDRKNVDLPLADEYGNWTGGGFGTLYQATVKLVTATSPSGAYRIVVWPAMRGIDILHGVVDVGIITSPVGK